MSGQDNVPARKGLWAMPVLLALVVLSTAARGAELPQWEAGIGISALTIPDYRGADQSQFYVFPIPYLIYRGDVLKVDRRAVRGVFFKSERLEVDTSFSGSPPVRSGRNGARPMGQSDPALVRPRRLRRTRGRTSWTRSSPRSRTKRLLPPTATERRSRWAV